MSKDFWATFISRLPVEDPDNPHPKGWPVIQHLVGELRTRGVAVQDPDNWRDSGYFADCEVSSRRLYFVVSYVGKSAAQWVVCCTADTGLLERLAPGGPEVEKRKLAEVLDRALKESDAFSSVRWYPEAFHGDPNEPWTSELS
jgi:hypothetical protein